MLCTILYHNITRYSIPNKHESCSCSAVLMAAASLLVFNADFCADFSQSLFSSRALAARRYSLSATVTLLGGRSGMVALGM